MVGQPRSYRRAKEVRNSPASFRWAIRSDAWRSAPCAHGASRKRALLMPLNDVIRQQPNVSIGVPAPTALHGCPRSSTSHLLLSHARQEELVSQGGGSSHRHCGLPVHAAAAVDETQSIRAVQRPDDNGLAEEHLSVRCQPASLQHQHTVHSLPEHSGACASFCIAGNAPAERILSSCVAADTNATRRANCRYTGRPQWR